MQCAGTLFTCSVASPGMGHVPPLEFDARKILQPFFISTYRPITHIEALITVTMAGCCKKTLVIFVFADLTPDGFHFWMTSFVTTNFGTRAPRVRALPPPSPLEQNSGDATARFASRLCVCASAVVKVVMCSRGGSASEA